MSKFSDGKIWPLAISIAITGVLALGIGTIIVTGEADVQPSDAYMTYYQNADAKANDYIKARASFNKKYNIEYINNGIKQPKSDIGFKITDKSGKVIKNAKIIIAVSRPETEIFNKKYSKPVFENGVYVFKDVEIKKAGIWNVITHVSVEKENRFFNIKLDTRNDKVKQFD